MEKDRTILHCDCNGFYASVECLYHPEYQNVPMAVCGDPENRRGIILAKNELAKKYNIETAETIWQARRKCPQLALAPAHHDLYEEYSRRVNEIYQRYTDLVEPFSIDESWLDVTGSLHLFGAGEQIADELRAAVRQETGLTISVGVSFNKTFAKMGSDYKKPDATTVISRENYRALLFPLPVDRLLFVGRSSKEALEKLGIRTIGDLARCRREALLSLLGKSGGDLYDSANGLDVSRVRSIGEEQEIKSVGNSITFRRDLIGPEDIRLGIGTLADSVAARLRRHGLTCGTVQVLIKNPSLRSISRQKGLTVPTCLSKELSQAGMELITSCWNMKAPIRMLALTGTGLIPAGQAAEQLSLFDGAAPEERRRQERLETALDEIRGKYGKAAVAPAGLLGNDIGIDLGRRGKTDLPPSAVEPRPRGEY